MLTMKVCFHYSVHVHERLYKWMQVQNNKIPQPTNICSVPTVFVLLRYFSNTNVSVTMEGSLLVYLLKNTFLGQKS